MPVTPIRDVGILRGTSPHQTPAPFPLLETVGDIARGIGKRGGKRTPQMLL